MFVFFVLKIHKMSFWLILIECMYRSHIFWICLLNCLVTRRRMGSHDAKEFAESRQLQVACFKRRPVRCAEWLPHQDGYKYTSTGGTMGCEMFPFPNFWALGWEHAYYYHASFIDEFSEWRRKTLVYFSISNTTYTTNNNQTKSTHLWPTCWVHNVCCDLFLYHCGQLWKTFLPVLTAGLKGFGAVFGRQYMDKGTTWLEIKDVQVTGNAATHETTCADGADGFVLL